MSELANHFRARRFRIGESYNIGDYRPAAESLTLARQDVANGREVYSTPAANGRREDSGHGVPFSAYGESRVAWFERPESVGLRFVGKSHDIIKSNYAYSYGLEHTGYFIDEFQHETTHGVVYQLPARNGTPRYLYGVSDPYNDGPALLSLEIVEGERIDHGTWSGDPSYDQSTRYAATCADSMAERYAEESREHELAFHAGYEFGELGDSIRKNRRELLAILAERKRVMQVDSPTLCNVIRGKVQSLIAEIQEAREKRESLFDEWEVAQPVDSSNEYAANQWHLFEIFQEGASCY